MITISNYPEKIKLIDFSKLPPQLIEGKEFYEKSKGFYNDSDLIKETIDLYFEKLNELLPKQEKQKTSIKYSELDRKKLISLFPGINTDPYSPEIKMLKTFEKSGYNFKIKDISNISKKILEIDKNSNLLSSIAEAHQWLIVKDENGFDSLSKENKQRAIEIGLIKTKKPKTKVVAPKLKTKERKAKASKTGKVYTKTHFTDHVKLAKRFVSFFGKPKSLAQVENLHKAIQKAVIEGTVPTTEHFKLMVEKTPLMLKYAREKAPEPTVLESLKDAAEQQKIVDFANAATKWPSVNLIKRYIAIANSTAKVPQARIDSLTESISRYTQKANTADPFLNILKAIENKGIKNNTITDFSLSGINTEIPNLLGVANYLGCACQNLNFSEPKK